MNNSARRYKEYKRNLEEKVLYNNSAVILGNTQFSKSERLIAENTADLIFEALNKDEFKKATKLLKKLGAIKNAADKDENLSALSVAIQTAEEDVNSYTGGGLGAMFKRLKGKLGGDNPLVKSLTFLSSLETGFAALEDILKNNNKKYRADKKDDNGEEMSPSAQAGALVNSENVIKNTKKLIKKAFQPAGAFAKLKSLFGSSGGLPYLKDVENFVDGLIASKPSIITMLISAATTGASAADVDPEEIASSSASPSGKEASTTGSGGGDGEGSSKTGEPTAGGKGATAGGKGAAAQEPGIPIVPNNPDALSAVAAAAAAIAGTEPAAAVEQQAEKPASFEKLIKYMKKSLASSTKVDQSTVDAVVDWLVSNKKLKTESKFYVSNLLASKRRNIVERWQVLAGIPVKKERSTKVMTEQYRYNNFDRWTQIAGISRLSLLQEATDKDKDPADVASRWDPARAERTRVAAAEKRATDKDKDLGAIDAGWDPTIAELDADTDAAKKAAADTAAQVLAAAKKATQRDAKEIVDSYQYYYDALARWDLPAASDDEPAEISKLRDDYKAKHKAALARASNAYRQAKVYTGDDNDNYKESEFTSLLQILLDRFRHVNFEAVSFTSSIEKLARKHKDEKDSAEWAESLKNAAESFNKIQAELQGDLKKVTDELADMKKKDEKQDPGKPPENYNKTISAIKGESENVDVSDVTLVLKALEAAGLFNPQN